jgi:hypothetical protein
MGLLMSLPRDLIYEVGINCDPLTLLAAARVSKHNRDLADNPKLWESVFRGTQFILLSNQNEKWFLQKSQPEVLTSFFFQRPLESKRNLQFSLALHAP